MILKLLDGLSSKIKVAMVALAAVRQAGDARCLQTPHTCAQQAVWGSRDQIQKPSVLSWDKDCRDMCEMFSFKSMANSSRHCSDLHCALAPLPTSTRISESGDGGIGIEPGFMAHQG